MVGFPVDTPVTVIVVDKAVFRGESALAVVMPVTVIVGKAVVTGESALSVVIPFSVIVVDKVGAKR